MNLSLGERNCLTCIFFFVPFCWDLYFGILINHRHQWGLTSVFQNSKSKYFDFWMYLCHNTHLCLSYDAHTISNLSMILERFNLIITKGWCLSSIFNIDLIRTSFDWSWEPMIYSLVRLSCKFGAHFIQNNHDSFFKTEWFEPWSSYFLLIICYNYAKPVETNHR